jgi:hypothetical protein
MVHGLLTMKTRKCACQGLLKTRVPVLLFNLYFILNIDYIYHLDLIKAVQNHDLGLHCWQNMKVENPRFVNKCMRDPKENLKVDNPVKMIET